MKKFLFLLVGALLIGSSAMAQDGKKTFKKANRLLGTYNLDPTANADKLTEAKDLIDEALADPEVEAMSKAWVLKGKIYNELMGSELNKVFLDPEYKVENLGDAGIACEALKMGLSKAEKKFEIKDAITALKVNGGHLSNAAITAFGAKDYVNAFYNFRSTVELNDIFIERGEDAIFGDEAAFKEQVFYTAVSGYYGELYEEAVPVFERAIEMGDPDPFMYEGLYNIKKETDKEAAIAVLNAGREKYPDDTALLYAEINYMVAEGQLEALIGKLEDAVAKDPDNTSVYTTLGAVYDNLSTQAAADEDADKANDYFNKSMEWFQSALEKEPENFDALYSLGALFYNKAATYTDALNELANDFSAEGNKKYDALKADMDALFDKSFPYFQKAEQLEPNDRNTLLAIKEIYARKGDLEKSNEYKAKLESLEN